MFYTYVLHCKKANKFYAGFSQDLRKRVADHQKNKVYSTKRLGDCKLIFYEAFENKKDAQRREKYFKTTKGKRALKLMLKEYLGPHRLVA